MNVRTNIKLSIDCSQFVTVLCDV